MTNNTGQGQPGALGLAGSREGTPTKALSGAHASQLVANSCRTTRVQPSGLPWTGSPLAQRRPGGLVEQRDRPLVVLASEQGPQSVDRQQGLPVQSK